MRPATSSGFSALLAPGIPRFRANSAIDLALAPGDLSFRCGNYPIPEVECGLNGSVWPSDYAHKDQRYVGNSDFGFQGGGGRGRLGVRGRYLIDDTMGGVTSVGRSSTRNRKTEDATLDLELRWRRVSDGCVGCERRTVELFGMEGVCRRVWVFHNYIAERGLKKQSLMGLSVWVANKTLSLLGPSNGGGVSDDFPPKFFFSEGIRDENGDAVMVFFFHRAFDSVTGLPVAHAEGNESSLAAAVSVLLLLGDGPEGGNDFPPITHATL